MADRSLRPSPNVAAVLVLAVLAGALLLWQRPWHDDPVDTSAVVPLPADASARLTTQLRDLSAARTESAFVDAVGDLPAGRAFGERTWRSLEAVAAPGASLRYISGGDVPDSVDGSATAVAEVEWRPSEGSGLDPAVTHRATVDLTVVPQEDGSFSLTGAARRAGSVPLWLLGAVTVDRDDSRVVLSVDGGGVQSVGQMASAARAAVERVVPAAAGDLVVISPGTQDQMAAIVDQPKDAVAQIAAVTTDIDGDTSTRDAVVVLNPVVFATMDERAAQVVLSHEATHALTPAVGTSAPNWVVEGFADYVALRDDTAPLSVSAAQILAEVTAGRGPTRLPEDADFGSTQHGLGAVYESAWMIFRMLGEQHPEARLVDFYSAVIGGTPVEQALDASFGLTIDELTRDWLDYLTKSASTVS